jgi:hypothetical protein
MKIILHNPGHNGDVLCTLGIVKKLINDNLDKEFIIIPACSDYLFNELLSDRVIFDEHPVPWNIDKNIYHKTNFISKNHDILWNYYNENIYINIWKVIVQDNYNCISLLNRPLVIINLLQDIYIKTGIKLFFHCINYKELIPILPYINIMYITEKIKSYNKKLIFFYNQRSYSGFDTIYPSNINEILIQRLLTEHGEDYKIILSKSCNIIHKNLINVETEFGNFPSHDGKNLIINANIANLCDMVFFKNNGGSLFLLNQINIANKNVKYYFIGDSLIFNTIKNEYELECSLLSI